METWKPTQLFWLKQIGDWAWSTCTERSRKACGIATLRAQPLVEKYGALSIEKTSLYSLLLTPHKYQCLISKLSM